VKKTLKYTDVEKILALAFHVHKEDDDAFRSKLIHFKRPSVGCIPGIQHLGRGKRIEYTKADLRHLFLALKLNLRGLDPKLIGRIYSSKLLDVDNCFDAGEKYLPKTGQKKDLYVDFAYRNQLYAFPPNKIFEKKPRAYLGFLVLQPQGYEKKAKSKSSLSGTFTAGTDIELVENILKKPLSDFSPLSLEDAIFLNFTHLAGILAAAFAEYFDLYYWEPWRWHQSDPGY